MIRRFDNIFFVYFKKHMCPECSTQLITKEVRKVVNSKSPEAKNYDFYCGDNFMIGNVEFIWTEFECPGCGFGIKIYA